MRIGIGRRAEGMPNRDQWQIGLDGVKQHRTRSNMDRWGQKDLTGPNRAKWGQTGLNRAEQGQTGPNGAKWGQTWETRAKLCQTVVEVTILRLWVTILRLLVTILGLAGDPPRDCR